MGTLYVGIDLYYPGAYTPAAPVPGAETYNYEPEAVFATLQALLSTDADTDPITPATYFQLKSGADLQAQHKIVFLSDAMNEALRAKIAAAAIPVPFPPQTALSLHWTAANGATAVLDRIIPTFQPLPAAPLTSALLLPLAEWPLFAQCNFAIPPITHYADLARVRQERRAPIQLDLMNWAVGLVSHIIQQQRNGEDLPRTSAEIEAYRLLAELDAKLGPKTKPTPQNFTLIKDYLNAPQAGSSTPRIGLLWEAMLQPQTLRPILAPRVLHDEQSLASDLDDLCTMLALKDAPQPYAVSYHHTMWHKMGELVAAQGTGSYANEALGRLYAFGERLRWSKSALGDAALMILKPEAVRGNALNWDAIGTNAQSLLGQVFRLPFKVIDNLQDCHLVLHVQGVDSADLAAPLRMLVQDSQESRAWQAKLARDADRPGGFFVYAPKMAEMTIAPTPPGLPTALAVPASLLDAVDRGARWSSPPGGPTMRQSAAPRSGLRASELYRPELSGGADVRRLSVAVRLRRLGTPMPTTTSVFEIVLSRQQHTMEMSEVNARFMALPQSGAQLWLTLADGGTARWDLDGQLLGMRDDRDEGLVAVFHDRQAPAATLNDFISRLDTPAPGGRNDIDGEGTPVELILPVPASADPLFNRVMGGLIDPPASTERIPLCILKHSFTSRVSTCTDRLLERFELTLAPTPFDISAADHPVLQQFGNYNKLRVALSSNAKEVLRRAPGDLIDGRWVSFLNYPDAIVPMKWTAYRPEAAPWSTGATRTSKTRHFSYFLSHIFTQNAKADDKGVAAKDDKTDGKADAQQRNAAESLRYLNYLTPSTPWKVEGYVEHQYSYRFPIDGPNLPLALATDIQHLSGAVTRLASIQLALAYWKLLPSNTTLRIGFPRAYLAAIADTSPEAQARPARLRAVYEPLADLLACLDHGKAVLCLERWVFHPDGPAMESLPGDRPTAADSGALTANMRLAGTHLYRLLPDAPSLAGLQAARDLLNQPFDQFEANLTMLANGTGMHWVELDIALDRSWSNLADPAVVANDSDLLRLGLTLERAPGSVVSASLIDPASLDSAPGFGLSIDGDRAQRYPEMKGEAFESMKRDAADELYEYLSAVQSSPLLTKFGWLRTHPTETAPAEPASAVPVNAADPEQSFDPQRFQRLFGETAAFSLQPTGSRPALPRVMDMYYVPVAFRPLRTHPAIGDAETTLEFAEFLIQLLDDISHGRPPQGPLLAMASEAAVAATMQRLDTGLALKVASNLADLLWWVHNESSTTQLTGRFAYVHQLASKCMGNEGRAVFANLFRQTPGLYASSKGFGLLIFEPDAWCEQLHSIQFSKRIHEGGPTPGMLDAPSGTDRDQIAFPRFFANDKLRYTIDVLDDARYDNAFEIDEHRYQPPRPPWEQDKGALMRVLHTRTATSATQARSGEDVIEQRHRFDDASAGERQIESDIVHWNPNWELNRSGAVRQLYLLPSRRAPATPVKLKARPDHLIGRQVLLPINFADAPQPDLNQQLRDLLMARLADNPDAHFGTSGGVDMVAKRLATPLAALLDFPQQGCAAMGWWHLESYGSEHYFLVETDEEVNDSVVPFSNDRFRILVEIGDQPFPDEEPEAVPQFKVTGKLGAWFNYLRQKIFDPTGTLPVPYSLVLEDIETELNQWLAPADPAMELLTTTAPLTNPVQENRQVRSWFSPGNPAASMHGDAAPDPQTATGTVLAAEIMQLTVGAPSKGKYVLKILLQDEPWHYTRVKVRIERNCGNVNGDDLPDLNPAFQMIGKDSAWSSHGRDPAMLDLRKLLARAVPQTAAELTPVPTTLAQFLDEAGPFTYGDIIGRALDAQFKDMQGNRQQLWNVRQARSRRLQIGGMVFQTRPDLHPRFAQAELLEQFDSRVEDIPRVQLIPLAPEPGNAEPRDFTPLLGYIDKVHVPSPHQCIRIIWANEKEETVFSCIWAVRFTAE